MSTNVTSSTLISKDLAKFRGKREKNLVSENTCLAKTHDGTILLVLLVVLEFYLETITFTCVYSVCEDDILRYGTYQFSKF